MARNEPAYNWRFPSKGLRQRLKAEAKARKWSLQTYLTYIVTTHPDRIKRVNNEEGS